MPLRTQKQLQVVMERANDVAIKRAAPRVVDDLAPLVKGVRNAKSFAGLKRTLGVTMLRNMGTDGVVQALSLERVKAAACGIASATPTKRRNVETSKRQNREAGKRQNVDTLRLDLVWKMFTPALITKADFEARSFDAAAERFGRKAALTHDQFEALAAEQKRRAFRVATVNNARLIQAIHDRLETAIRQGRPWRDFYLELLEQFETAKIPAPALHRLKLAFRQNTLQAYSDARKETLDDPDVVAAFPYRQYLTVGNGTAGYKNVRREHAVLHRLVFRWDDPFWISHRPPWDYNCRCSFRAVSEREVKRKKLKVRNAGFVRRKLKVKPKAGFGETTAGEFDLSGLTAELRKAVEGTL